MTVAWCEGGVPETVSQYRVVGDYWGRVRVRVAGGYIAQQGKVCVW